MSEIITDKLTGRGVAKTVTVTVGASATQPLEEGLAKVLLRYVQSTDTTNASFNISSETDDSTGTFTANFSNNFSDGNIYVFLTIHNAVKAADTSRHNSVAGITHDQATTSSAAEVSTRNGSHASAHAVDIDGNVSFSAFGDLA